MCRWRLVVEQGLVGHDVNPFGRAHYHADTNDQDKAYIVINDEKQAAAGKHEENCTDYVLQQYILISGYP